MLIHRKWLRWLCVIAVPVAVLAISGCARLNIPYASNAPLAHLQASLGIHAADNLPAETEIIGHRGSALLNPGNPSKPIGNTKNAIQAGIDAGVDWIEIDLRHTSDGTLVLFHDEFIRKDTDADEGKVADLTLESLRRSKISVVPPERILTLKEFGEIFSKQLADEGIGLILDIKSPGLKTDVLAWIAASGLDPSQVIVFGEYQILAEYQQSGLQLGYTFTWKGEGNRTLYLFRQSEIINRLRKINANFLVIPIIFCGENLIVEAKNNGISTWAYGSEDPRDWEKVRKLGVNGLIVDYPEKYPKRR